MKSPFVLIAMVAVCSAQLLWASPNAAAQPGQSGPGQYGTVHFPVSCRPGVQEQFERAVAMLHSFFYPETIKAFEAIIAADPDCAMAYWGLAISQRPNPLVPPWAAENLRRGLDAVQKGKALAKTERERDWLTALEQAYAGYDSVPTTTRSERYERAMEQLARKYPDDKEAAIFYALALLEAVDHRDKTYARQIKAAAIMEPIDRAQPNHPGLAHYIVHAYDFEPLAARGVSAADKYARVAPSAPHAQHMPSHIYSMLGRWEDSIRSNQAAVKASREYAAQNFPGTTFSQEPHAQDFMAYAYLQLGQNREAKRVTEELAAITKYSGGRTYGRDTGQVAPAARYVLERAAWSEALSLPVRTDVYVYAQAMPRFVRAVGAAKLGKPDRSERGDRAAPGAEQGSGEQLLERAGSRARPRRQRLASARGRAERRGSEAHAGSRRSRRLDREARLDGESALPDARVAGRHAARDRPAGAGVASIRDVAARTPNRLRGFYGAAKAAKAIGDSTKARDYFEKLAALARNADPDRVEVQEARAFLTRSAVRPAPGRRR